MTHIMILARDALVYRPLVAAAGLSDVVLHACETVAEAMEIVGGCEVILGQPDMVARVLPEARKLVWVQSTFAGVDALCAPGLRRDYLLTGVKGIFGPLMSEYVFGYILARERKVFDVRAHQLQKAWRPLSYRSLRGMTLGVCGLGSIGAHVAETGHHFGMKVVGYRRSPKSFSGVDHLYSGDAFHGFLARCDYVVSVLPATPATRHLFDRNAFSAMKPSSVFMNVGRGSTVCEADLFNALAERQIAGAVLDVFEEEPLSPESPLWTSDQVVVTPHIAACSFPEEVAGIFIRNVEAWQKGSALSYPVDFEQGY